MLMSMTGFGKVSGTFEGKKVTIELRSLNSKSLDLNMRLASTYKELEPHIRNLIAEHLDRGKIDLIVQIDSTGDTKSVSINKDLAKAYFRDLQEVNTLIGGKTEDYLSLILRMPDIYNNEREELSEAEKTWILDLTKQACDALNTFRRQEGKALENEFSVRIGDIRSFLAGIPQYEQERIETVKDRIRKGLEELQAQPDQNRLEQEMIFYIEKMDVSEEKMRLTNHLDYFMQTLSTPNSGKKLGFISQEIGREINTLGSKSNHVEMQKLVVGMKDALEKIKEQVLNTL
ncbi:MAG: YicC family protein [Cryomorphaceae bacterium]|nr:YicC family protein [Cryomorphaceae bacterium]